jgi:hypothetical protein
VRHDVKDYTISGPIPTLVTTFTGKATKCIVEIRRPTLWYISTNTTASGLAYRRTLHTRFYRLPLSATIAAGGINPDEAGVDVMLH